MPEHAGWKTLCMQENEAEIPQVYRSNLSKNCIYYVSVVGVSCVYDIHTSMYMYIVLVKVSIHMYLR